MNMNKHNLYKRMVVLFFINTLCISMFLPAGLSTSLTGYTLPPPMYVEMPLEETIFRRMSVREFTEDPVTDEELSTVLWTAYGYTETGNRAVHGINGVHTAHIYILKEDAVYKYNPEDHSLLYYKEGDYRYIGQYDAPIQLAIVWNTSINDDENLSCAEIGAIGQNIHFVANAIDMGTVVTAEVPSPIEYIGLPADEVGKIVMPIGHPDQPYDFLFWPMWFSFLPRIQVLSMTLTDAVNNRSETSSWESDLSRQEQTQMIWASYGYSYYFDRRGTDQNPVSRHRTVPSAHGYYPLRVYGVMESGVYRYFPNLYDPIYGLMHNRWRFPIITFLLKLDGSDRRVEIAQASESFVSSAPLLIIFVLDIENAIKWDDLSGEQFRWLWYYEAGAGAHNVLLEATAWNLSGNIASISDDNAILSVLGLDENYDPLLVIPVGKASS